MPWGIVILLAKLESASHIASFALSMSRHVLRVPLMWSDLQASLPREHLHPFLTSTSLSCGNLFNLTKLLWLHVWSLPNHGGDSLAGFHCFFINYSNECFQFSSNYHCSLLYWNLVVPLINISFITVSMRKKQHDIYIYIKSNAKYKIYQKPLKQIMWSIAYFIYICGICISNL